MRSLALALSLFLAVSAAAQQPDVLREYAALRKECAAAWAAYRKESRKAHTIEEVQAVANRNPDLRYLPRTLDLAEKYAADPAAVVPALEVFRNTAPGYKDRDNQRALAILLKQIGSKYLIPAVPTLVREDESTARLLTAVLAKHSDAKTRARACKLLQRYLGNRITKADRADLDEEYRTILERQTSPAYVKALLEGVANDRKEYLRLAKLMDAGLAKELPDLSPGTAVPNAAFIDLAGKKHRLHNYRGKIVLVHVFRIDRHQPEWLYYVQQYRWSDEFKGRPVVRVHISVDDRKESFTDWLKYHPLEGINVWAGADSDISADWLGDDRDRMQTYVIDPRGVIVMKSPATNDMHGPLDWKIQDLLKEMGIPPREMPPAPKARGRKLTEAGRAYEQLRLDFRHGERLYERLSVLARTDAEKRLAGQLYSWVAFSRRALSLAEKYIDDPASFDLLAFCVRHNANTPREDYLHALHLLAEHHAGSPRMMELLPPTPYGAIRNPVLLRKVLAKNPNPKVKARACLMLKELYEGLAGGAEQYLAASPQIQTAIRRRSGNAYVDELLEALAKNKELRAKYIKLYNEKYAKVLPEFKEGRPMPDTELITLDGKKFKLSDLRGKVVYVNIFSALEHKPRFDYQRQFTDQVKGKPFVIVNVSVDERKEDVVGWLKRDPTPAVTCWCGRHSELYADWMMTGYATAYLIDAKGVLRVRGAGWADLPGHAEALLEEMAKGGKGTP
jgi:peroxiredoxin